MSDSLRDQLLALGFRKPEPRPEQRQASRPYNPSVHKAPTPGGASTRHAPGAPNVFIDDAEFVARWKGAERWYVVSEDEKAPHLRDMVGGPALHVVVASGGKTLYVNQ